MIAIGIMFLVAAVDKAINPGHFRGVVSYLVPSLGRDSVWSAIVGLMILLTEAAVGVGLIFAVLPKAACLGGVVLLVLFCVPLIQMMMGGSTEPCQCGFLANSLREMFDSAPLAAIQNLALAGALVFAALQFSGTEPPVQERG